MCLFIYTYLKWTGDIVNDFTSSELNGPIKIPLLKLRVLVLYLKYSIIHVCMVGTSPGIVILIWQFQTGLYWISCSEYIQINVFFPPHVYKAMCSPSHMKRRIIQDKMNIFSRTRQKKSRISCLILIFDLKLYMTDLMDLILGKLY